MRQVLTYWLQNCECVCALEKPHERSQGLTHMHIQYSSLEALGCTQLCQCPYWAKEVACPQCNVTLTPRHPAAASEGKTEPEERLKLIQSQKKHALSCQFIRYS